MKPASRAQKLLKGAASSALLIGAGIAAVPGLAEEELDEFFIRVEINASDGDAGLHIKLDGEGWQQMNVSDPDGHTIYDLNALAKLAEQGQTESFSESTEPPCFDAGDGESYQTLKDFLARFREGEYMASGMTTGSDPIGATYTLMHELPAAPNISRTDGRHFEIDDDDDHVVIRWRKGSDFGECSNGNGADDDDLEPAREVALWEITVEPDVEDEELEDAGIPKTVYTVQIPGNQRRRMSVPNEYFRKYLRAGISEFKFEVGGKVHENLTFSEGGFTVEYDD